MRARVRAIRGAVRAPVMWLCVSATAPESERLRTAGPRRDFIELQRATGGVLVHRASAPRRAGWRGRLLGPHVAQAWRAAARMHAGDVVFADGEHVGLPLLAFLRLRRRLPRRLVMLGHLPGRRWKRLLFALLTRGGDGGVPRGGAGVLAVHSLTQASLLRGVVGPRWRLALMPYQVDASYWRSRAEPDDGVPLIVAAGREHRDYATLLQAVEDLPVQLVVAAGSHWARRAAARAQTRANVRWIDDTLPFSALRDLYERAALVVVPLHDVPNQSGVTTILEAMSMARPVVVSATIGQREIVRGPVVRGMGDIHRRPEPDRGPHLLFAEANEATSNSTGGDGDATGCYVPPGDVDALRSAIEQLIAEPEWRRVLGNSARAAVERYFTIDAFTDRLALALGTAEAPSSEPAPALGQPA